MKYSQKHYATPPAHLKILHIQSTTSPEKTKKDEWFYSTESHCSQESLSAGCCSPLALLSDPQQQGFLGRYTETCVQGWTTGWHWTAAGTAAGGMSIQTRQRLQRRLTRTKGQCASQLFNLNNVEDPSEKSSNKTDNHSPQFISRGWYNPTLLLHWDSKRTWKCMMMVQTRPRMMEGLPSMMSETLMLTSFICRVKMLIKLQKKNETNEKNAIVLQSSRP